MQGIDKYLRGRFGEELHFSSLGIKEHGSVFRNDALKQGELGEDLPQVIELPAGDQDELATGGQQSLQRAQSAGGNAAHVRQRLIEIASEGEIVHTIWMTARLRGLHFNARQTKGARLSEPCRMTEEPQSPKKRFRVPIWIVRLCSFNALDVRPTVKHPSLSLPEPYSV